MLTIKYVGNDGREVIHAAESVDYFPHKQSPNDFSGITTWYKGEKTEYVSQGLSEIEPSNGKLYVMNEHGKTVATYTL